MAVRLPRSVPSAENVDAAGIEAFLDAIAHLEMHSVMILRHGRVLAEGWWHPYTERELHLGYSLTKSMTSVAFSYALADGLVSLDDRVLEAFGVAEAGADYDTLTVRDLARMTTGHHVSPEDYAGWPPLDEPPGKQWIYNNWASFKLGALVQKKTGRSLSAYLEPRLFEPLDIEDWAWHDTNGVQWGFSGLHLTTESWAKFGHLLLRGGELFDRQVIDADYLREATSLQADNSLEPDGRPRDVGIDWTTGYGYQFWVARHGFRGDGAFGQLVVVLPEQDMVLVTTAGAESAMQEILDAAWTHLLPAVGASAGRASMVPGSVDVPRFASASDTRLAQRLAGLTLPPVSSRAPDSDALFRASADNAPFAELTRFAATSEDRDWELTLWLDDQLTLHAGDGYWITSELPGAFGVPMPVAASAGWTSEDTFEVELRALQTPHGIRLIGDSSTGEFRSVWTTEPLGARQFRQLALRPGQRRRG